MKAAVMKGFGGPEVLALEDMPRPEPGAGQVLVRVMATSVNRADIVQREGNYPPPPGESDILGLEVAGEVAALGEGVSGWRVGERVMGLVGGGGYAEYALAWAEHLIRIPDTMAYTAAACVCETYITAFLNLFLLGGLADKASVLLHGGGGGVNTAAIQLCRILAPGALIAVTASPAKVERVQRLGADLVINYQAQDFAEEIRRRTDGRGVDVILDHIGAAYLQRNLRALAREGKLVVIGVMGGSAAEINLAHLLVKRQQVIGSSLRSRSVATKAEITATFVGRVMPFFESGRLAPLVHAVLDIGRVAEAHRMMEDSRHFGKIVLKLGGVFDE
jgi:putative PIG3 family NAD(P)H quinone oxidoreductase